MQPIWRPVVPTKTLHLAIARATQHDPKHSWGIFKAIDPSLIPDWGSILSLFAVGFGNTGSIKAILIKVSINSILTITNTYTCITKCLRSFFIATPSRVLAHLQIEKLMLREVNTPKVIEVMCGRA